VNTHLSDTMCTFIQAPRRLAAIEGFPARAGLSREPDHRNPRPGLSARMDLELIYGVAEPGTAHGAYMRMYRPLPDTFRVWVPPVPVVVG
jgi:hypothetical protein